MTEEKSKKEISWVNVILLVCLFILGILYAEEHNRNKEAQQVFASQTADAAWATEFYEINHPEEQLCTIRFPECHSWESVSQYDGTDTCFWGQATRRLFVSGFAPDRRVWYVFFDPEAIFMPADRAEWVGVDMASLIIHETKGLVLISDYYGPKEDTCVAVFGKVRIGRVILDVTEGNPDPDLRDVAVEECSCGH